jgi:hypothetical protein
MDLSVTRGIAFIIPSCTSFPLCGLRAPVLFGCRRSVSALVADSIVVVLLDLDRSAFLPRCIVIARFGAPCPLLMLGRIGSFGTRLMPRTSRSRGSAQTSFCPIAPTIRMLFFGFGRLTDSRPRSWWLHPAGAQVEGHSMSSTFGDRARLTISPVKTDRRDMQKLGPEPSGNDKWRKRTHHPRHKRLPLNLIRPMASPPGGRSNPTSARRGSEARLNRTRARVRPVCRIRASGESRGTGFVFQKSNPSSGRRILPENDLERFTGMEQLLAPCVQCASTSRPDPVPLGRCPTAACPFVASRQQGHRPGNADRHADRDLGE